MRVRALTHTALAEPQFPLLLSLVASQYPEVPGTSHPSPLTRTRPEANPESVTSVLAGLASALPYRNRQM